MARRRYQQGQLFLRGSRGRKVWVARWREDIATASPAKPRRIYRSKALGTVEQFPTRKLARRQFDLLLADRRVNALDYRPGRIATVAEFAAHWERTVLSQRKPATRRAAEMHLRKYIRPQLGGVRLDDLSLERQQQFMASLASRNLSQKSIVNILGTLSSMMNVAKSWGYLCQTITRRALVIASTRPPRPSAVFSADQVTAILFRAPEPFATLFDLLALTGLRTGEALGLAVGDIDLERRTLRVTRSVWRGQLQTVKSKASAGVLPVPAVLCERLKRFLAEQWRQNPEGLLFVNRLGRPFSDGKIREKVLHPILRGLGLPQCGMHAFRHTHTSLLMEQGTPAPVVQAQLRHSDPSITLGVYGHIVGDGHRAAVEKLAQVLHPELHLCAAVPSAVQ